MIQTAINSFLMPEAIMDTPRLFTAIAEWLSVFVYLFMYKRRKNGAILVGYCAIFFVLIALNQFVAGGLPIFWWIPTMLLAVGIMYAFMYVTLDIKPFDCGLLCSHSFVAAELGASLYRQLYVWQVSRMSDSFLVSFLTMLVIYAIAFFLYYRVEKDTFPSTRSLKITKSELLAAILTAFGAFLMSNISFVWSDTPFSVTGNLLYVRTLVDFGGLLMLITQQDRRNELMVRQEKNAIDQLFQKQYEQYKLTLDNSELLRKEMHDLKHYLIALRGEEDPVKREEVLSDMEQAIAIQESFMNTGNNVLDVILTAKSLACNKAHIALSAMVDGSLLSDVHVKDICSLFGNILDNAIEAAQQVDDVDLRIINLTMQKKNQFIVIECENYCNEDLDKKNLPKTSKKDVIHHGYGLKSIRQVAEKYQGGMSIDLENNWFKIRVLLGMSTYSRK